MGRLGFATRSIRNIAGSINGVAPGIEVVFTRAEFVADAMQRRLQAGVHVLLKRIGNLNAKGRKSEREKRVQWFNGSESRMARHSTGSGWGQITRMERLGIAETLKGVNGMKDGAQIR